MICFDILTMRLSLSFDLGHEFGELNVVDSSHFLYLFFIIFFFYNFIFYHWVD